MIIYVVSVLQYRCTIKVGGVYIFHYYADSGFPAGSSDDISRVHGGRGGLGVVDQTGVVGVVLLQGPHGGVLNGLLLL